MFVGSSLATLIIFLNYKKNMALLFFGYFQMYLRYIQMYFRYISAYRDTSEDTSWKDIGMIYEGYRKDTGRI